jgi:2-haloacid dehalogenase
MTTNGPLRWLTFDCFGTLVDWRHGIRTGADLVVPGRGTELLAGFVRHEPDVQTEHPGWRYREVLAESLRRACADAGVELLDDDASVLGTGLPYWPVFADVGANLSALREAGWNLAILTNCDRDLIAQTQRRLAVPFDAVVTAEDVGAYKPAHAHFRRFEGSFRPAAGAWVHVAQSWFHDVEPARELGLPVVWVNRGVEERDAAGRGVSAVLSSLDGVLEAVDAACGT